MPALGILVLSTAASITGTVAWFTAQNTATASAGNFQIEAASGGLAVACSAGVGTTASGSAVTASGTLADASFDHVNQKIVAPDRTGTRVSKVTTLGSVHTAGSTDTVVPAGVTRKTSVYSVMTWKMTFSMEFGSYSSGDKDYGLYFNALTSGGSNLVETGDAGTKDSINGFRMAFVGQEADAETRVWANKRASNVATYVDATSLSATDLLPAGTSYTSPACIGSDANATAPSTTPFDALSAAQNKPIFLGRFDAQTYANSTANLTFIVVVWFEGTDTDVVNGTTMNPISANLKFEAQQLA